MTSVSIHKLTPADTDFHAQFFAFLQKEFAEIPWLTKEVVVNGETYATIKDGKVIAGITLFPNAPEDTAIIDEAKKHLNERPAIFASCFTVAEEYRKQGNGLFLAKKVLQDEVFAKGKVAWGVFQKPTLADFYAKHFACELYPLPNNLRLIIFTGIIPAV